MDAPGLANPIRTAPGQNDATRALSTEIGRLRIAYAKAGLPPERIIEALRDNLVLEEVILRSAQADARSYR